MIMLIVMTMMMSVMHARSGHLITVPNICQHTLVHFERGELLIYAVCDNAFHIQFKHFPEHAMNPIIEYIYLYET